MQSRPARSRLFLFVLLAAGRSPVYGQPVVQSVTDSAAYGPRVAPGSLASIFGKNLAGSKAQASHLPLPTSLGGTSVEIQGASVPLLYVDSTQINFQVPSGLSAGQASLIVHAPAGDSSSFTFQVVSSAPAIFQYGANRAIAQNGDSAHTLNSSSAPAAAGSVITVYLTGQGPVDNAVADGAAAPDSPLSKATASYKATIGVKNAPVQFLGLTPGFAGLAQANIQVPSLPSGDYPLVLTVGGIVSVSAIVSVSGSGTPYTSPLSVVGTALFSNPGATNVALYGNTAYVCGPNRIVMVDVTNPSQPAVVGSFAGNALNGNGTICRINTTALSPYLVDVVGPLSNNVSFAVYDLTSPRSPQLLGIMPTQYPYIVDLDFFGTYGFASVSYFTYYLSSRNIIAQDGAFLSFDFTTPGAPQLLTAVPASNLEPAAAVVNQAFAYVASSTATGTSTLGTGVLNVMNIGAPTSVYAANQVTAPPASILQSLAISGNTLLAAGNTTGNRDPGIPDFAFTGNLTLTTMDITNSVSPTVLASFDTGIQVNGTFHIAAFTNGVFAVVSNAPATDTSGPATLSVVDARQPANPVLYPVQTQFGLGGMVATSLGYLLTANSLGFTVYQLQ
jgi:uncharacterized protein (TIGR03437 family)